MLQLGRTVDVPRMARRLYLVTALIGHAALAVSAPLEAASSSEATQEVTIEAQRLSQSSQLREFVDQVAIQADDYAYARWQTPICPLVAGLSAAGGEFLLTRLSQIARDIHVALAGPDCRDFNLYIVVTSDPESTLKAFARRDHDASYGDASLQRIRQFIDTPAPVRVWYNVGDAGANGAAASTALNGGGLPTHDSIGLRTNINADATRLELNVVWGFRSVFVTVDAQRLRGVSNGQLADYVAMVSLAQLRPGAVHAVVPSVLHLFDSAPASMPASLTPWDQAFLKALYEGDAASRLQREHILHSMQAALSAQP